MTILRVQSITSFHELTYADQILLYCWDIIDIGDVAGITILQLDWDAAFTFEWNLCGISKSNETLLEIGRAHV